MRRSLLRLAIPMREPFVTSHGVLVERELAVIRLEDDDGTVGFGEGAPLDSYDGVTVDDVVDALRDGPAPAGLAAAGPGRVGAGRAGPPARAGWAVRWASRWPTRSR